MYGYLTLAATLLVATISGLIVVIAPRLEDRDTRRAAYGDPERPEAPPSPGPSSR